MRSALVILLLLTTAHADFLIEQVDVTISDIRDDGAADVHESIKFVMFGNYSNSLYDSGIGNNELSWWSTNIGLKDVKFHVNPAKVDIRDLRVRPQPRTKCNPIQGICHGELIIDYEAYPSYVNGSKDATPGTGLFTVEKYKPRTRKYTINPDSLSFTTTPEGNIILEEKVFLTVRLPSDSVTLDVNPMPSDLGSELPARIGSLTWTDIVLVKFSLVFDVEDSIDKEVSDFFGSIANSVADTVRGPYGAPLIVLVIGLIGSYVYIITSKRRGEE
ncbi:MAG: hypothetical protein AB1324_00530 [Candidatus Micrarchaeota archaeon]